MRLTGRYRYFFITYVGFLVVTIAIAGVAYGLSYRVIRDAAVDSGQKELEFSRRILEARIDDIHNTVSHLAANAELSQVANIGSPVPYPDYYSILRFQQTLPLFNIASTFIDDIVVYFYRSDLIVSNRFVAVRMPVFYENFFTHDDLSYEEWVSELRSRPYRRSLLPAVLVRSSLGDRRYVRFYQSFPLDTFRSRGVIMVYVTEEQMMAQFESIAFGDDGFVAVFSGTGELIAATGSDAAVEEYLIDGSIDAARLVMLESHSPVHDLTFVAGIPTAVFFQRVNLVGLVFLIIIAVELLAGIAFARFLAIRNMRPLRDLAAMLAEEYESGEVQIDELKLIETSVERIVKDNRALHDTLERQAPLIRSTYVEQLLSGKFSDESRAIVAEREAGVNFDGELFAVCLVSIRTPRRSVADDVRLSSQPLMQALLEESWKAAVPFSSYSYNMEPGVAAVILNPVELSSEEYHEQMQQASDRLVQELRSVNPGTVIISCSELVVGLLQLRVAYNQAKAVHDFQSIVGDGGCTFYEHIKTLETNRALFDLETENALSRSVIAGECQKTRDQLDALWKSITHAAVPAHSLELAVDQLEGALLRTGGALIFSDQSTQQQIHAALERAGTEATLSERFNVLRDAFAMLCERVEDAGRSKHRRVLDEMQTYLSEHASDPQVGLHALADAFRLSPPYASRFFKEHAGIGMADFLERIRIERAQRLLATSGQTVAHIAREVGYTNSNTFYKAFKRITGVTAVEYRQRAGTAGK